MGADNAFAVRDVLIRPGLLDRSAQEALVAQVRAGLAAAPLVRPVTRRGTSPIRPHERRGRLRLDQRPPRLSL